MILKLVERRSRPEALGYDWGPAGSPSALLAAVADPLGAPGWVVDVVLVDDQAMAELNRGFRQVSGVTDVLSFSYLQEAGPGAPDLAAGDGHARANLWLDMQAGDPENGSAPVVGEVVLAPGFVVRRCREKGWPVEHEIPLLLVHGMLHILGWDHADDRETEDMQAVEEKILAAVDLPHPLRERS